MGEGMTETERELVWNVGCRPAKKMKSESIRGVDPSIELCAVGGR